MANVKSAKKRARRAVSRTAINSARRSRIRSYVKKVATAIAGRDKEAASAALKAAEPELMRGVSKGLLHRNTAARKISRLAAQIKSIQVKSIG